MTTYESKQKQIRREQGVVYDRISDLRNAKPYVDAISAEMRQGMEDVEFTEDSVSFKANMVGRVTLKIIDRESPKMLKFQAEGIPLAANLWIQLVGVSENDTRMKVTVKADVPLMLRPMIGNRIGEGVERFADMLAYTLNEER
ncbi:MAG: SRPBCC family protein [Paludibacteraceae bacterium]|nr:SRPBCC family protein [Paludibacteraceae bacterium]